MVKTKWRLVNELEEMLQDAIDLSDELLKRVKGKVNKEHTEDVKLNISNALNDLAEIE